MRYTLLLTSLILTSISVKGQSKTVSSADVKDLIGTSTILNQPVMRLNSLHFDNSFIVQSKNTILLKIAPIVVNQGGTIDSLVVYVKKSQIIWLNDSTAVIYKP